MKQTLTTIIMLLLTVMVYSQTVSVYVPMRTYHWDRSEATLESFHNTEGGNFGAIFIFRNHRTEKVFTEKQYGLFRNSYGDASLIIQQGVGYSFKNFNLSLSAGLATGYHKVYENGNLTNLPGVFKNNGITPTLMTTISYTKYRWQPTINISPTFINGGIIRKFN